MITDDREHPLLHSLFDRAVEMLPPNVRTAIEWTRYLPLETVLDMPWDVNEAADNALSRFRWSTEDLRYVIDGTATSDDRSCWPFQVVTVPLMLLARTMAIPRALWQGVPEYVTYLPIRSEYCKAFLVLDATAPYGLRPMTVVDVRDALYLALRSLNHKA